MIPDNENTVDKTVDNTVNTPTDTSDSNPNDQESLQRELAAAKATIDQQDKEIASLKSQVENTTVSSNSDEVRVTDSQRGYIRQLTNILQNLSKEMNV